MSGYSQEQIYDAMRKADAAGDAEAVRALAAALQSGASKQDIQSLAAEKNLSVNEADLDANIASRDAGGPVNEVLPPEQSWRDSYLTPSSDLGIGLQSSAVGALQGVAGIGDLPFQVGNSISSVVTDGVGTVGNALLSAVGADDAAQWWSDAAEGRQNALAGMRGVSDLLEEASPTPPGMEGSRFASQLISGLAVPFGPKAAPRQQAVAPKVQAKRAQAEEAAQIVQAGEREGVRVMTSDVRKPRSFLGRNAQATAEKIPFAGTGGPRAAQNEERVQAVKNLARDFGVEGSEELIDGVAEDLASTRGGRLAALSERKKAVIEGITAPFQAAPATVRAINEQVRRLQGIDAEEYAPVIERLQRFGEQLTKGKTLAQVEGQRKLLGDLFADTNLAKIKTDGQAAINKIYGPLREDMGEFIKANGGEEAYRAWKSSNDELAAMAGELNNSAFRRVLSDAETTPENAAKLLFSRKPSEVRRLFANLSADGKEKAKAAVLHEAIQKAGGLQEVSPKQFANALDRFGKTTGIIFGKDNARIEGIVRLLQNTQRASEAAAAPPTGVQNTAIIGSAVLTDWLGGFGSATTAAGIAGVAARLYESAPVRNLLVGLSKSKPGSKAESAVIKRIDAALASQTGINGPLVGMNDNVGASLAASDRPENQNK